MCRGSLCHCWGSSGRANCPILTEGGRASFFLDGWWWWRGGLWWFVGGGWWEEEVLGVCCVRVVDFELCLWMIVLCGNCHVESVAGAAHLPTDNAGVLRCAGCAQKSPLDQRVTRLLDSYTLITKNTPVEAFVTWCCPQHDTTTTC